MHKFIINSTNFLYKNYIIRISEHGGSKEINLVSYKNLIDTVHHNIVSNYSTNAAPCFGNWTDNSWYYEGLGCHLYNKKSNNKKLDVLEYISLIDDIHKYNSFIMDEFWFFICLVHFTDPVTFNSLNFEYWNYSWVKTKNLSKIFEINNLNDGMERFYKEGEEKGYILKIEKDRCLFNKEILFNLFLKALMHIEHSIKLYEKYKFELLDEQSHVIKINHLDFYFYKNKIIFLENDIIYFTQFNNLKSITELPKNKRKNEIYNQFMNNKKPSSKSNKVIKEIPSKELTGQMTSFYLNQILLHDEATNFIENVPIHIERELKGKKYMEDYVRNVNNKTYNVFTDKINQDIASITNNDFYSKLEKFADSVKQEHTAINHIKHTAKLLKKDSNMSLMKAQDQIVKELFNKNSLAQIYSSIKDDIVETLKNNDQFIYAKEKNENLVFYGKNHIGFYSMKDISHIKHHMAFLNGDKIIEKIKDYYPIVSLENFILHKEKEEVKFILVEDIKFLKESIVNDLLIQGRSFNKFLIFNFKTINEILNFIQNDFFTANIHDILYSRELYEILYGNIESNKIAVKSILKSGRQLEYLL